MAARANLSDKQKQKIVDLKAGGMTGKEIANKMGVSTYTVFYTLKKFRGTSESKPRKKAYKYKEIELDTSTRVSSGNGNIVVVVTKPENLKGLLEGMLG